MQTRSLVHRQGESAFHFVRVFKVLEAVHELLRYLLCSCKPVSAWHPASVSDIVTAFGITAMQKSNMRMSWLVNLGAITQGACHGIDCSFRSRKKATQRDLYYRLLHPPIFCNTRVRAPAAALALLHCTKYQTPKGMCTQCRMSAKPFRTVSVCSECQGPA